MFQFYYESLLRKQLLLQVFILLCSEYIDLLLWLLHLLIQLHIVELLLSKILGLMCSTLTVWYNEAPVKNFIHWMQHGLIHDRVFLVFPLLVFWAQFVLWHRFYWNSGGVTCCFNAWLGFSIERIRLSFAGIWAQMMYLRNRYFRFQKVIGRQWGRWQTSLCHLARLRGATTGREPYFFWCN